MLSPCPNPACKGKVSPLQSFFFPYYPRFVQGLGRSVRGSLEFRTLLLGEPELRDGNLGHPVVETETRNTPSGRGCRDIPSGWGHEDHLR